MTNIWRSLLLALAVLLIIAGCGQDNNDNSDSFVQGTNSDVVAVRVVGNFPASVTQFRASVLSASAQLIGQQTAARTGAETNVQVTGVPRGNAIVRVEALTADGSTQSFYQVPVTVPLADGFLVAPSTNFNVGPAPSPTPIPSPGSSASPSGSPSSSPSSSPSTSPSSSPSTSPSSSPSTSPSSSPSTSPSTSPTASPSPAAPASPSPFPSPSATASPSPGSSPTTLGTGSLTMQSETIPAASPNPARTDFIGQGRNWSYRSGVNGQFQGGLLFSSRNGVRISVSNGTNGDGRGGTGQSWGCSFRGTGGNFGQTPLAPGTYPMCERASFAADNRNGLDVSGDGRGNNRLFGEFTIFEIQFDPNNPNRLTRFSADFVQYGEQTSATGPALRGQVRFSIP